MCGAIQAIKLFRGKAKKQFFANACLLVWVQGYQQVSGDTHYFVAIQTRQFPPLQTVDRAH